MAYKITGTVLAIGEAQTLPAKSGSTYTKRDLILTIRKFDQYTGQPTDDDGNTPKFTFMGEKCRDLDSFKIGDIVTVSFEVNGRAFINKDGRTDYFTDLRPVFVGLANQTAGKQNGQPVQQPMMQQSLPGHPPYNPVANFPSMSNYYPQAYLPDEGNNNPL